MPASGAANNDFSTGYNSQTAAPAVNVSNISSSDTSRLVAIQQQFYGPMMKQLGFTSMDQLNQYIRTLPPSEAASLNNQFNVYANNQVNPLSSFDKNMSTLAEVTSLGAVALGAGAALGAFGAAGAGGAGAGTGVASVTDASLATDTGSLLASNSAAPALGGSLSTDVASGTIGLGSAPSASVLPTAADLGVSAVNPADLTMSLPNVGAGAASGLSSYLPKNIISSGLQSSGVNSTVANAAGGAVQGAGTSALRGGNPLTGAISGGFGGAYGGSGGIGSDISSAAGGGTTGGLVAGAIGGGIGTGIVGGNPLTGAITGGVGGGVTGATGSSAAGGLASQATGYGLASTTGSSNMSTPNPMSGSPMQVTTPTIPSVGAPTATATQGLPGTGIPNGAASISPAGLISGTGLASAASSSTAPTPTVNPGASSTAGTTGTDTTSSLLNSIGTGAADLLSGAAGVLGGNTVTSMAPYLAVGAIGLSQANQAKTDASNQAATVAALGTPYTQAGTQLLNQYQSGTLTPAQQSVVDTATAQGNTLLASDPQLQAIYTQAFGNYASGTLRPADQLALDQSVAAQKAQVRQNLSSMGITDSTILAAHDQQIDNQAVMTKQNLLDAQFATGNQAFSTWAQTTQAGQALILQGQQYAVTSLQQTLNNALNAGQTGMNPVIQSVQMQIAADAQIGTAVSDLMGNLAKAYAYSQYQSSGAAKGGAGTPGGSTGQTGSAAAGAVSSGMSNLLNTGSPTGGAAISNAVNNLGAPQSYADYGQTQTTAPTTDQVNATVPAVDPNSLSQQSQLDAIYGGSFNPSTSTTSDLVNYVSYAGTGP